MSKAMASTNRIRSLIDKIPFFPSSGRRDDNFLHKRVKLYKTPIGNYFLPTDAPNDIIVSHMRTGRIFEPEVVDIAEKYIKKGSMVLDIGANFGQMSILFSELVGEAGQVFSFEADDFVFSLLEKNIDANNCVNVRPFLAAVYDKSGETKFFPVQDFKRFPAYGSYGLDPNASQGRKIKTLAIDDLDIREPISFMKIDVQGSDLFALYGAVQTIKRHQMPIMFEYEEQFQQEFNTSFQDYLDFIRSISYKVERTIYSINYLIVPDTRKSVAVPFSPDTRLPGIPRVFPKQSPCKFLKSRQEIDECTAFLHYCGYRSHFQDCKNWDLAHILPEIGDGNFLDMGSSDSSILANITLKRIKGELYGIDLRAATKPVQEVHYIEGDLMDTKLPGNYFENITCLSVIEHGVDFSRFAREVSRLLVNEGKVYVTFDYWTPKVKPSITIYGLKWDPLDDLALKQFLEICKRHDLHPIEDMDWTINDPVIRHDYYSPQRDVSYTFGLVILQKKSSGVEPVRNTKVR